MDLWRGGRGADGAREQAEEGGRLQWQPDWKGVAQGKTFIYSSGMGLGLY